MERLEILDHPPVQQPTTESTETQPQEPTPQTPEEPAVGGQPTAQANQEWWTELGYESQDKVRETLSQHSSLIKEREALKQQLEQNSIADPAVTTLNGFLKKNQGANVNEVIAQFARINSLDLNTISPLDAIRQSLQLTEGMDKSFAEDYILAELSAPQKPTDEEWEDMDERERSEYKRNEARYKVKLQRESASAIAKLNELKESFAVVPAETKSPEQIAQEQASRMSEVSGIANSIEVSFSPSGLDEFKFELTPDQRQELSQAFASAPGTGEQLKQSMEMYVKAKYTDQIIQRVISAVEAKNAIDTHSELTNASPTGTTAPREMREDPDQSVSDQIHREFQGY